MRQLHPNCRHPYDEGCMWCCVACDTDRHICPGCGASLEHNEFACVKCLKEAKENARA